MSYKIIEKAEKTDFRLITQGGIPKVVLEDQATKKATSRKTSMFIKLP